MKTKDTNNISSPDQPTPRTDAAWSKTLWDELNMFWSGNAANKMREECATLERELTAELTRLRAEVERWKTVAAEMSEEREHNANEASRLRTEVERLKGMASWAHTCIHHTDAERANVCPSCAIARAEKAEADNAKWQKLLLMSRDDREIDLISEIEEQARLLGMSGEREADLLGKLGRLESELAAIKNGHGELGKYEQLRLKNAELQAELAAMKGKP